MCGLWKRPSQYFKENFETMEKNKVYKFGNSLYEVNKTIVYPKLNLNELDINDEEDQLLRENYLNNLKSLIMQYGGSYISTGESPSLREIFFITTKNSSRFFTSGTEENLQNTARFPIL